MMEKTALECILAENYDLIVSGSESARYGWDGDI